MAAYRSGMRVESDFVSYEASTHHHELEEEEYDDETGWTNSSRVTDAAVRLLPSCRRTCLGTRLSFSWGLPMQAGTSDERKRCVHRHAQEENLAAGIAMYQVENGLVRAAQGLPAQHPLAVRSQLSAGACMLVAPDHHEIMFDLVLPLPYAGGGCSTATQALLFLSLQGGRRRA